MVALSTKKQKKWDILVISSILFCFTLWIHLHMAHYPFDDAYIHFRVARNFFDTGYPYYNIGEPLKVSTSSGWIALLAPFSGLLKSLGFAQSFSMVVGILNAVISFLVISIYPQILALMIQRPVPLLVKLAFQFSMLGFLLPSSVGLMETPLAILLAGVGIYALLKDKPWGYFWLGIGISVRIELVILLGVMGLYGLIPRRFRLFEMTGYSLLGISPFLLFDMFYYHTIIPHSILAKSNMYQISVSNSLLMVIGSVPGNFIQNIVVMFGFKSLVLMSAIFFPTYASWREKKTLNGGLPFFFCLWSLGIISIYVFGRALVFPWYTPLFGVPIILATFACFLLLVYPKKWFLQVPAGLIVLITVLSITHSTYAFFYARNQSEFKESSMRVAAYLAVGKILFEQYPSASLLTSEIGGLGYSFEGHILDAAGLASADAVYYHPMKVPEERSSGSIGAIPPGYVLAHIPDIIVSYDIYAQALMQNSVLNNYNEVIVDVDRLEGSFTNQQKGNLNGNLRVFVRNTLPISERLLAIQLNKPQ